MKNFFCSLATTIILSAIFYLCFNLWAFESPLGIIRLASLMLMGTGALLVFWEVLNSAPQAWKELVFCWRRRQWKRRIRAKEERRQGTTTVVLE